MSSILESVQLSHEEQGSVNVLTRGSGIDPLSLTDIRKHLTITDKTAWEIIKAQFGSIWKEKVSAILKAVTITKWVEYSTRDLVTMLLDLPGWDILQEKLDN